MPLREETRTFFSRLTSPVVVSFQRRATSDPPPVHKLPVNASSEELALVSTIVMQKHPAGQEIARLANPEDSYALTLGLRAGTRPEEHIYLSSAPLDSEAHLSFLNELEVVLRG